ncbi:hypothetical protein [Streptomyces massasporeus]|uniref:hypothetical protein n=1 Tax=Streptomyces massasporeus TaxID=67324 RepID=UPI0036B4C424
MRGVLVEGVHHALQGRHRAVEVLERACCLVTVEKAEAKVVDELGPRRIALGNEVHGLLQGMRRGVRVGSGLLGLEQGDQHVSQPGERAGPGEGLGRGGPRGGGEGLDRLRQVLEVAVQLVAACQGRAQVAAVTGGLRGIGGLTDSLAPQRHHLVERGSVRLGVRHQTGEQQTGQSVQGSRARLRGDAVGFARHQLQDAPPCLLGKCPFGPATAVLKGGSGGEGGLPGVGDSRGVSPDFPEGLGHADDTAAVQQPRVEGEDISGLPVLGVDRSLLPFPQQVHARVIGQLAVAPYQLLRLVEGAGADEGGEPVGRAVLRHPRGSS